MNDHPIYAPPSICDDCAAGALEHLHDDPEQALAVYCTHHAAGGIHELGLWRVIGPCTSQWFGQFVDDQRRVRQALAAKVDAWRPQ